MEVTSPQICVPISEASQVGEGRARATELAATAGFDETDAHRVGLVATELGTNLVKHAAPGGELFVRQIAVDARAEIELLSVDSGPGIVDVRRSLEDGFSTAGSSGTGLGAIQRLSETFDLYTQAGRGTAVVARLRVRRQAAANGAIQVGAISLPKPGEPVCGDAWHTQHRVNGGLSLLVADGLGHGLHAADAARAAASAFARPFTEPSEGLERIHNALRHTRGAAAGIADIRPAERIVRFAGVGNIAGAICGATATRQTVSHNGTLGHQARYFRDYSYPWEAGAVLVMHSDGLGSQWSLDTYPGLRTKHPTLVAAVLYRDLTRRRDDVTVVVARERA